MRILVIDDDANLVRVVRQYLEPDGHMVLGSQEAQEGLRLVVNWHPDLILLDIVMPDMDGRQLCERVRRVSQVPIVFLTSLGEEMDIVSALVAGADEYLVKPPRGNELRARIRALLRQGGVPDHLQNYYDDGYLVVDVAARRVQRHGSRVDLSPIEFRLLSYLVARRGQLISRQELIEAAWGHVQGRSSALLHLYIRYLRAKLEPEPSHPRYLLNRFGEGYWFEPHDSFAP
jgi:DNA-binding response OmpR family regulator